MAFNIKNEETHALVRELADKTGESMSQAVDTAIRERLMRVQSEGMADRLMAIGAAASEYVPPEWRGRDSSEIIDELLYDERGLPK